MFDENGKYIEETTFEAEVKSEPSFTNDFEAEFEKPKKEKKEKIKRKNKERCLWLQII
mgnify:CR=1 FL=1